MPCKFILKILNKRRNDSDHHRNKFHDDTYPRVSFQMNEQHLLFALGSWNRNQIGLYLINGLLLKSTCSIIGGIVAAVCSILICIGGVPPRNSSLSFV
jgi:hypothetical protein